MNIINFLDNGAARDPDRACFICNDVAHTYADVQRLSARIAHRLAAGGMGPDHKAAVLSINDPVAFTCVLGILRSGAVWVPLNPRNTADDNRYLCDLLDVEVLFYHSMMAPMVAAIAPRLEGLSEVICIDKEDGDTPSLEAWLGDASDEIWQYPTASDATALIVGTGGTTGRPKGVELSHANIEIYVASHLACSPEEAPPVFLAAAPLTHAAGVMVFPMLVRGGTTVILPIPAPEGIVAAMEAHRVTDIFLPPTVIYMLLALPGIEARDFSALKYFYYGAAPMSVEKLKQAFDVFGPVMTQYFGQSEAPMAITHLSARDHFDAGKLADDKRLTSCGRATPFVNVQIMDDDGNILGPGEVGEIVLRSSLVMKGYYKNPEASAEASAHGWHHTGDVGMRDAEGFFYIVDRKKDMIITGGFNVYSTEVEQAVLRHPAVLDCAVIGVPDEKWGEAVKAVVQLKPGAEASEEEIIALCKDAIGAVKAPKSVEFRDDLPRSPVGKVLKREIRDAYWQGKSRAI